MINQAILNYNQKTPRYTSYPTAPHFNSNINNIVYKNWLSELTNENDLSLYFHIPFCKKLCWYCGCHTKVANKYSAIEKYTHALIDEVKLVRSLLKNNHKVTHIHFGGGSPDMLSSDDFKLIMRIVAQNFDISVINEIAIELDPRNINEGKVAAYAKMGLNRVSLGVQDFHDNVQQAINRIQPYKVIYDAVKLLRDYDIKNINFDLMYGLPEQTIESIKQNIDLSLGFKPSRISFFGYAHVPQMKRQMQLINESKLPNPLQRLEMFEQGSTMLEEAGYVAVGLDHFVLPSDSMAIALKDKKLKRNFQGYTTDSANTLIGFGVSSISKLPQGYLQNTADIITYQQALHEGTTAISKGIEFTADDTLRNKIIEQVMCYLQVDISQLCYEYKYDLHKFDDVFQQLSTLEKESLVKIDSNKIIISSKNRQISRFVASLFDSYFKSSTIKHSQLT